MDRGTDLSERPLSEDAQEVELRGGGLVEALLRHLPHLDHLLLVLRAGRGVAATPLANVAGCRFHLQRIAEVIFISVPIES